MLARLDQPKLAASQIFDCGGVAAKTLGLFAKELVLGPRAPDRLFEHRKLLTLFHALEQPFLPDQRIDEDHATDQ